MNPFLNPLIAIPFTKQYLFDAERLNKLSSHQLQRFRDKALRNMVSYAYTIPLYHTKYKQAHIHPSDIHGIKDIIKLPTISRQDFSDHFPDGIVPRGFNTEKNPLICTGGTTTKYCCNSGAEPVCTFTDIPTLLQGSLVALRKNRFFGLTMNKTRFAHVGNFNPYKFDQVFEKYVWTPLNRFFSLDNYLSMQASRHTQEIMKKLVEFKPEVIISYPAIFQDIAYHLRKEHGNHISPKLLLVGGAMLDEYTRRYVEDSFGCPMFNTYSSCEAGAEIAFECTQNKWHVHSDFFHLEAVDDQGDVVQPGDRGRLIITKLRGGGTPLIRYTGMEDWITLGNGERCRCGLNSPILGRPVEGRVQSNICLPDGRVIPPSAFLCITSVLKRFNTFKVRRYQIVQKKKDEIDILLVLDEQERQNKPSFYELAAALHQVYQQETGPEVCIRIREVEEIEDDPDSGKPAPLVVSYVPQRNACSTM